MNRILVVVFSIVVLPYLGIPNWIDAWIISGLVCFLLVCMYWFVKEHNITFSVPTNDPDDFLNEHNVMDSEKKQ